MKILCHVDSCGFMCGHAHSCTFMQLAHLLCKACARSGVARSAAAHARAAWPPHICNCAVHPAIKFQNFSTRACRPGPCSGTQVCLQAGGLFRYTGVLAGRRPVPAQAGRPGACSGTKQAGGLFRHTAGRYKANFASNTVSKYRIGWQMV